MYLNNNNFKCFGSKLLFSTHASRTVMTRLCNTQTVIKLLLENLISPLSVLSEGITHQQNCELANSQCTNRGQAENKPVF